jgi:hypothetical protein
MSEVSSESEVIIQTTTAKTNEESKIDTVLSSEVSKMYSQHVERYC